MKRVWRYLLGLFFFGLFFSGGIYGGYTVVRDLPRALAANEWPIAEGRIVESKVRRRKNKARRHNLLYSYTVDGWYFDGTKVTFMDRVFYSNPVKLAERYPKGATVSVHYQPDQPSIAVLDPNVWWLGFSVAVLTSLALTAIGGFGLRATFR